MYSIPYSPDGNLVLKKIAFRSANRHSKTHKKQYKRYNVSKICVTHYMKSSILMLQTVLNFEKYKLICNYFLFSTFAVSFFIGERLNLARIWAESPCPVWFLLRAWIPLQWTSSGLCFASWNVSSFKCFPKQAKIGYF